MAEVVATENGEDFSSDVLRRGSQLGRYELVVPVAVGGMARVWAARMNGQRGFTKLVAIKTILPHLARDPDFERMFLDEARIASQVHHPNVCEIYELGDERGVLYLAMEWVNGASLAHVLRNETTRTVEPIDPRVAARIVADACAGLNAAHNLTDEQGKPLEVVHRDVSPHNILLSADGNVKVADFGVAKAFGQAHAPTAAGQLKGRIAYMAPEQASGGVVDRRSDLFSLGCVLYEATTGKQPFQGENEHRIMTELIKGQFTPPSRVVRGYPFELERIVLRAMAAAPLQRFPSMDKMQLALEEWLAKSGPVVTQAAVAAVVRGRVGAVIDARKERIRGASGSLTDRGEREATVRDFAAEAASVSPPRARMSSQSNSGVVPAGEGADRASSLPPSDGRALPTMDLASQPHASPAQYAMAAAIGIVVAAILGVAGFYVWRAIDGSPAPAANLATASAMAAAVSAPTPASSAPPAAMPSAPAIASGAIAAGAQVTFKVVPPQAILIVDGAPLGADVRAIARPSAGASETVIVRADGFDDETLKIDDAAPTSVDVWLTPKKSGGKGRDAKPGEPKIGHGPPNATPAAAKKGTEALPANPY